MYKTTTVYIEFDIEDVKEFLDCDFYDLNYHDYQELSKIMKNLVFNYPYYEEEPTITSEDIIEFLKKNTIIAAEVKKVLNQNEMV